MVSKNTILFWLCEAMEWACQFPYVCDTSSESPRSHRLHWSCQCCCLLMLVTEIEVVFSGATGTVTGDSAFANCIGHRWSC